MPAAPSPGTEPKPQAKVRTEFPETWLWSESRTGYHTVLSVLRSSARRACQNYPRSFVAVCWQFLTKNCIVFCFRQIFLTLRHWHGTMLACATYSLFLVYACFLFKIRGCFCGRIQKSSFPLEQHPCQNPVLRALNRSHGPPLKSALNFLKLGCGRSQPRGTNSAISLLLSSTH